MKVAFFEVQDWEEPFIVAGLGSFDVRLFHEPLDYKNLGQAVDAEVVSVFIYSQLDRDLISKMPQVRLVATRSTGFDHIDLQACKERGILVCNVPQYGETTVAEHAFALILSLSRMIHDSYERTRQGDFSCEGVRGFELNGKTLGVLGTGRIGTKVIEIARGFSMNVLAYDKFPNANLAAALGFRYVDWPYLLKESDVVSLHLPLNDQTFHFLNKDTISAMKQGAVVINTARGALIDSQALTEALRTGHLRGAGLDVLEEEALIREEAQLLLDNVPRERLATMLQAHILLRLQNVIITPHCAFNSKESLERLVNGTIENIKAFAKGQPQNIIE
ncbi:MAG: hydroxyacid dehydrogenase [Candidatus Bathyarchaeota archaeon]|nr:hydroxyacid dehydrogenase [Candidatus Bathyarchaeota archaeon]